MANGQLVTETLEQVFVYETEYDYWAHREQMVGLGWSAADYLSLQAGAGVAQFCLYRKVTDAAKN